MREEEDSVKRHTNNDIWGRIHDQGKQIADLQTGLGKLESRVEGGFASLSGQMSTVLSAIDRLSVPKPPPDIKGWIALAVTLATTLGLIGLLVVTPMQHGDKVRDERQWELMQNQAYERGYLDAHRKR